MAKLVCTRRLRDVGPLEPVAIAGATVSDVLTNAAQDYPRLLHYILDDQGRVRPHVAIFVDGDLQQQNHVLSREVAENTEIYLMQALSGG